MHIDHSFSYSKKQLREAIQLYCAVSILTTDALADYPRSNTVACNHPLALRAT
jgi:hypothetical protein